jgi:hypothetical protein
MGPFEAVVAMVVGGMVIAVTIMIGTMFKRFMLYKERQLGTTADATAEKAAQYASHVQQLEQRVRVLERIATDKGADLAQQIEDLRADSPALAQFQAEERA